MKTVIRLGGVRRRQDDDGAARPRYASLRHRRNRERIVEDQNQDEREKLTFRGGSILDAGSGSKLQAG